MSDLCIIDNGIVIIKGGDDQPDYIFKGELLGQVQRDQDHNTTEHFALFRNFKDGGFVCLKGYSYGGEPFVIKKIGAVETDQDVIKFFGLSILAKRLYQETNIDYLVEL